MAVVGFYDALPIDRLDLYGPLVRCSRFRPHTKVGPVDVVLSTWTRVANDGTPVVSCRDSAEHLRHITAAPVYQAPGWAAPQVAVNASLAVIAHGDRDRPVAVCGMGRIGNDVASRLQIAGWDVRAVHHDSQPPPNVGTVVLALADRPEARGWLHHDHRWRDVVVVNFARPWMVASSFLLAVGAQVRVYLVDGGKDPALPGVVWTPHTAWSGPVAARLRVASVLEVLTAVHSDRLALLPLADISRPGT